MTVKINVRNLDTIKKMLDEIPAGARGIATRDAAFYLIGNERRGLQHYPKQAAHVTYRRTYNYRFGWRVNDWNAKTKIQILNDVPYAKYVRTRWAGSPWNWHTIDAVISDNMKGTMEAIDQSVQRYIKEREVR